MSNWVYLSSWGELKESCFETPELHVVVPEDFFITDEVSQLLTRMIQDYDGKFSLYLQGRLSSEWMLVFEHCTNVYVTKYTYIATSTENSMINILQKFSVSMMNILMLQESDADKSSMLEQFKTAITELTAFNPKKIEFVQDFGSQNIVVGWTEEATEFVNSNNKKKCFYHNPFIEERNRYDLPEQEEPSSKKWGFW